MFEYKSLNLERKFASIIKAILGQVFFKQNILMDLKQATDFLTFELKEIKIAVRLRTFNYFTFRHQFTIRCELQSGKETELDKIRKGFCDYLFYGFVDEKEEKIIQWFIGDLKVFRNCESVSVFCKAIYENKDERPTKLAVYNIKDFPKNFIVRSHNLNL